jgi:nucleoside-diphosphate-sugar epimerase
VFASTSSVYGAAERHPTTEDVPPRPISPYGVTKLSCEHLAHAYIQAFGLDVVTLRYFSVFGPRQRPDMAFTRILTALVTGGEFTVYGTGEQSRDFTYVDDAVAATIAAMALGRAGAVYNVGGGGETTLAAAIRLAERLAGETLNITHVHAVAGDARRTRSDTELARRELGWRPQTTLDQGLARQLDHVLGAMRE